MSINTTIILKITRLVIKYGYMFRLILSHPQANMVTEFRYIKYAPNGSHYVYKIFRKIKILKYCKKRPNHIYRTELLVCQLYKL